MRVGIVSTINVNPDHANLKGIALRTDPQVQVPIDYNPSSEEEFMNPLQLEYFRGSVAKIGGSQR